MSGKDINTDELKIKFNARSIPMQEDFHNLIEMADIGRRAVGLSISQQSGNLPHPGLKLDSVGRLCFDFATAMPVGTILMWGGEAGSIPDGWKLCDGKNGTPDMIDRFIIGGEGVRAGTKAGRANTASFAEQGFVAETTVSSAVIAGESFNVEGTALTVAQMPRHNHEDPLPWAGDPVGYGWGDSEILSRSWANKLYNWINFSSMGRSNSGTVRVPTTTYTGGGLEHGHGLGGSSVHDHQATVSMPYYVVIFIIKV